MKLGSQVILDSDHGTWNAYGNNYWPRFYLMDAQGYLRYDHIGEGNYNQIEKSIQSLVAERAALMGAKEITFDANPTAPNKPGSLYYVDLRQSTTPESVIILPEHPLAILKASIQNRQFHIPYHQLQVLNLTWYIFKASGKTIQIIWNCKVTVDALF